MGVSDGGRRPAGSAVVPRPRVAALVARTELRRSVRALLANRTQTIALTVAVALFVVPAVVFGASVAHRAGVALRTGEAAVGVGDTSVLGVVRGALALFWVATAVTTASRAVGRTATVDEAPAVLTATTTATAVAGLLLAEAGRFWCWVAPPVLAIAGAFAVGLRSPLPAVGLAVVLTAPLLTAVPVGWLVGLWVRRMVTGFEWVARHKGLLGGAAFVAYMAAIVTGTFGTVGGVLFRVLQDSPLGWLGDLALLGTPGLTPSLARAAAGLVAVAVVVPVVVVAGIRTARGQWFDDPARPANGNGRANEPSNRGMSGGAESATDSGTASATPDRPLYAPGRLLGMASPGTRVLARVAWLRARRAPVKLVYAAYPLLFLAGVIQQAVERGRVTATLPALAALYTAWATGATFTLNPLGDQGAVLPATLSAPVSGRTFVRGHLLAGALVGVPGAALVTFALGVASPLSLPATAALAGGAALGAVLASGLATGIGVVFPRFGAVNVVYNRRAVAPSKVAFAVYSLVVVVIAAVAALVADPGLRSGVVAVAGLVGGDAVTNGTVRIAAAVTLALLAVVPYCSYRIAVGRFAGYRLE